MNTFRITVTLEQAQALLQLVRDDNTTKKNHIATSVEHCWVGDLHAVELVKKLREGERLFATVNGAILRATGVIKD